MVWVIIGCGGALGSAARHAFNVSLQSRYGVDPFPIGIFAINVLGCLVAGLLAGLVASARLQLSMEARSFLFVGVLGGFTTFSAFGLDTLTLVQSGHELKAAVNVVGQVGLGLVAVHVGYLVATAGVSSLTR